MSIDSYTMKTGNNPLTLTTRRFHIYIHTYIHTYTCMCVCMWGYIKREREREQFQWTSGGQIQTAAGGKLNGK